MTEDRTRGGRKLDAAVSHFKLAARVRGASAVDVGASTGGFVSVLLEHGAHRVTAIDVGHGQLADELARDGRVTSLERTDFKTLSLDVAPGPFDFFTVDVSFVAARSMLRGLAFRLRAGAEGVVLVKPQFELPSHLVKDGQVDAPDLRMRAVDTFRTKADRLGFELLGYTDSPVAGGSGTVEILAHLRFAGRPASMPKMGERKPASPHVPKHAKAASKLHWFAVASPGLEQPLCAELVALGAIENPRVVEGGVEFAGTLGAGMAANLHSRIATRIVLRMGEVKARDFAPLRRSLAKFPWQSYIPADRALRIDVSTSHCRLYHTGALAETVELAITDRVGKLPKREKADGTEARTKIARASCCAGRTIASPPARMLRDRFSTVAAGASKLGARPCARPWPRACSPCANTIPRCHSWIRCAARAPSLSKPRPWRAGWRPAWPARSPSNAGLPTMHLRGKRCVTRRFRCRTRQRPSLGWIATAAPWTPLAATPCARTCRTMFTSPRPRLAKAKFRTKRVFLSSIRPTATASATKGKPSVSRASSARRSPHTIGAGARAFCARIRPSWRRWRQARGGRRLRPTRFATAACAYT